jgi:hypothetical protein
MYQFLGFLECHLATPVSSPFPDFRFGQFVVQNGDRQVRAGLPEMRQVQTERSDPETPGRHVGGARGQKGGFTINIKSSRVTRFGEFSPNMYKAIIYFGQGFFQNYRSTIILLVIFSYVYLDYVQILTQKIGLAILWSIFSQTHLVTLKWR